MERADVIISGGGLVGLTLALALDAHGVSSIVYDPADPDIVLADAFDGRASAIASASWHMLEAIGVADRLKDKGCPIAQILVSEGTGRRWQETALDFTPDSEEGALGRMFENRLLRRTLHEAAKDAANVTLRMKTSAVEIVRDAQSARVTLSDGSRITAPLLIVAEGRRSPTRDAAGIKVARWSYDHSAIVTAITHELHHQNTAYEIFYPSGPFAILPLLPGTRSAIVWSVAQADAPGMVKMGPRAFAAELQRAMGGLLGEVALAAPRSTYPLGFHHTARMTAERLVLVGDAAHGIHPIAGQGLNLGLRDVAALAQVLVEGMRTGLEPGDAQLLARYERWRSLDTLMVAGATDGLTRLFGIRGKTASAVRKMGLSAVRALPPLKARFMAEARGESGKLPALLTGSLV